MWLWVVGIVAVVGAVTVVAVGSGASLGEVYEDRPDRTIPVGRPLRSDDLQEVTFTTALRGYRMDEVDALLARVRADLLAREAHEPAVDADGEMLGSREPVGGGREPAESQPRESVTEGRPAEAQAQEPDTDERRAAEPEAPEPDTDERRAAEPEAPEPANDNRERLRRESRDPGADDRRAAEPGAG